MERKKKDLTEKTKHSTTSRIRILALVRLEIRIINPHRSNKPKQHRRALHPGLLQRPLLVPRSLQSLQLLKLSLPRPPSCHCILPPLLLDEVLLGGVGRQVIELVLLVGKGHRTSTFASKSSWHFLPRGSGRCGVFAGLGRGILVEEAVGGDALANASSFGATRRGSRS